MAQPRILAARGALALVLSLSLVAVGTVHAQDLTPATPTSDDLALAKAHYKTGELNYAANKLVEAAKEFEEAYRLSQRPELLYNMGKCYDKLGDPRGALVVYRRFLETVKDSPDRPFIEKRTAELNLVIAHLEIKASVDGAVVTLDGQRLGPTPLAPEPREVNPGEHRVEIAAEGYATYREKVTIAPAQTVRIDAKLVSLVTIVRVTEKEKEVPVYKRWYLWTPIALVVVAGAVVGGVLGARAANNIDGPHAQLPEVK
ncbi:MAG: PEGA domain-containing protein [Polyangia bacterium]